MSEKALPETTIGELMDQLRVGREVSIRPGQKLPGPEPAWSGWDALDSLMRRCHRYHRERLSDGLLLNLIDVVAEYTGRTVHYIRKMTIAEFVSALDLAMGKPKYGPDPKQPILWWDGNAIPFKGRGRSFLLTVWGRQEVSYAEIGEAIWGDDSTPSNRIHQLIKRLNEQLGKLGVRLSFASEKEQVSPLEDWPR